MWWNDARGRLVLVVGIVLVLAAGCADHSIFSWVRGGTRAQPPVAQDPDHTPSRSDRLRGDGVGASASAPEPVMVQERRSIQQPALQPPALEPSALQPPAQAEPGLPPAAPEPDPRAVIDWLLKDRR
jgi:hypothetical protein